MDVLCTLTFFLPLFFLRNAQLTQFFRCFRYAGIDGPLYAFSLFTPSIINSLGYTATNANLLSVPIYTWACILTVLVGFLADRRGQRIMFNFIFLTAGAAGYIILISSKTPGLSYFAIFLAASGIYPLIPNTISIVSNNCEGSYKRSIVLAVVISFGNLNGAVSILPFYLLFLTNTNSLSSISKGFIQHLQSRSKALLPIRSCYRPCLHRNWIHL